MRWRFWKRRPKVLSGCDLCHRVSTGSFRFSVGDESFELAVCPRCADRLVTFLKALRLPKGGSRAERKRTAAGLAKTLLGDG